MNERREQDMDSKFTCRGKNQYILYVKDQIAPKRHLRSL